MDIQYRKQLGELCETKNAAAEIGVAEGNFSKDILNMGFEKLYMVDNWATIEGVRGDGSFEQDWHDANFEKAKEQVAEFGDKAVLLRGMSKEMSLKVPDESLDLIHIDAGHDYTSVYFDLKYWFPKVKKGGIISGHDYLNTAYGVHEAVNDFTKHKGIEVNVIHEDKSEDAGFWFRKPL